MSSVTVDLGHISFPEGVPGPIRIGELSETWFKDFSRKFEACDAHTVWYLRSRMDSFKTTVMGVHKETWSGLIAEPSLSRKCTGTIAAWFGEDPEDFDARYHSEHASYILYLGGLMRSLAAGKDHP